MSGHLEAVIWDMDGVIVDTAAYHFKAWQETFARRGLNYTEEEFRRYFGQRNDTIIRAALGQHLSDSEVESINNEKQANYRQRVAGLIKLLPGALRLIKALKESGLKMAIASSAPLENILLILDNLSIRPYFDALVYGEEVAEGKPSPQEYLLAAKKLEVAPENCVVIEDAIAGVEGAKQAGMKCVAVTNTHPGTSLAQADLVVDTLEAVTVADLAALF